MDEAFIKLGKHCTTDVFQAAKDAIPYEESHPLGKKAIAEAVFLKALKSSSSEKSGKISILLELKDKEGNSLIDPNKKVITPGFCKITPLMYAAAESNSAVVSELLKNDKVKKNINMKDSSGFTAYRFAYNSIDKEIAWILLRNGAGGF